MLRQTQLCSISGGGPGLRGFVYSYLNGLPSYCVMLMSIVLCGVDYSLNLVSQGVKCQGIRSSTSQLAMNCMASLSQ